MSPRHPSALEWSGLVAMPEALLPFWNQWVDEVHLFFVDEEGEIPEVLYYWYPRVYPPMYVSRITPRLPRGADSILDLGSDRRDHPASPPARPRPALRLPRPRA
jgi:hypothetical protein